MDEKEQAIREELAELERRSAEDPEFYKDRGATKRLPALLRIVGWYDRLKKLDKDLSDYAELRSMLTTDREIEEIDAKISDTQSLIQIANKNLADQLLPKDPNNQKDCIIEIRAAAGGDESSLFAGELFRMYSRWAETHNYKLELITESPNEVGGFKEITFAVRGDEAYKNLKFEAGVHRVQRVPATESQGRVHTSTVTVAVLPEAEETDVEISPSDLRIDVYRSGGHGGQSVNTTDSAVRITHLPTGLVVSNQDEKSQIKNKAKAMSVLRSRLLQLKIDEDAKQMSEARRKLIGSGDRSEKIRTYNFPQDRITDHRINYSRSNIPAAMDGSIDDLIDKLQAAEHELLNNEG